MMVGVALSASRDEHSLQVLLCYSLALSLKQHFLFPIKTEVGGITFLSTGTRVEIAPPPPARILWGKYVFTDSAGSCLCLPKKCLGI